MDSSMIISVAQHKAAVTLMRMHRSYPGILLRSRYDHL